MVRVLLVGIYPEDVDFTDPALPPGLDADKIRAGIAASLAQLTQAGLEAFHQYIPADPAALGPLRERLATDPVDCVVIGGGVSRPPANVPLFEAVLNIVAATTPTPRIALVATPHDAPKAVERALALA